MKRWDNYFKNIAIASKSQSRCLSGSVGCVIVRDNKYVVSMGYNGPPSGFPHPNTENWNLVYKDLIDINLSNCDVCPRRYLGYESGQMRNYCPCVCAERNAIAIAAKLGQCTDETTIYLSDKSPCLPCAQGIITSGIKEVVVPEIVDYEKEGFSGTMLLQKCGIKLREYE